MPGENKIDPRVHDIEAQIHAAMRGATNVINCPYCKKQNVAENESLCCADFGLVVRAVLRKMAQGEVLDKAERIAENAYRMGLSN